MSIPYFNYLYLLFVVTFALQINSFYLLTIANGWIPFTGSVQLGGGQSNPVETGFTKPFTVFGRAVIGCLSRNSTIICTAFKVQRLANPSNELDWSSTMDRWLTVYFRRFLRHAYYLTRVLSALLTTISVCGERFTLIAEAYSAPLRYGSLSPTFFIEVVLVGYTVLLPIFTCMKMNKQPWRIMSRRLQ